MVQKYKSFIEDSLFQFMNFVDFDQYSKDNKILTIIKLTHDFSFISLQDLFLGEENYYFFFGGQIINLQFNLIIEEKRRILCVQSSYSFIIKWENENIKICSILFELVEKAKKSCTSSINLNPRKKHRRRVAFSFHFFYNNRVELHVFYVFRFEISWNHQLRVYVAKRISIYLTLHIRLFLFYGYEIYTIYIVLAFVKRVGNHK